MLFCVVPVSASSSSMIAIGNVESSVGNKVTVPISIEYNPGFVSMSLSVTYDTSALMLISCEYTDVISGSVHSANYTSPYILTWENDVLTSNITNTGTIVYLTFLVSEDAKEQDYSIIVRIPTDGILDANGDTVSASSAMGTITVSAEHECSFGDWEYYSKTKHVRSCDDCDEKEYKNHNWNDGEIIEEPSHDVEGEIKYTCEDCGATKTTEIDAEEHDWSGWTNHSDTQHKRECSCGEVEYKTHAWDDGIVTKEPTATTTGIRTYTCNDCEATKTESIPADTILVTGVQLDKTSITMALGISVRLNATITPSNATNKNIIWTSSNATVASVSGGLVTANKVGSAEITATTEDGSFVARCDVTVQGDDGTTKQGVDLAVLYAKTGYFQESNKILLALYCTNLGDAEVEKTTIKIHQDSPNSEAIHTSTCYEDPVNDGHGHGVKVDVPTNSFTLYYISALAENDVDNSNNYTLAIVSNTFTDECWYSHDYDAVYVNNGMHKLSCKNCDFETTAECWYPEDSLEYCVICGADAIKDSSIPVSSITLSQATATVTIGKKLWLDAIIQPSNATNQTVDWTSSNEAVAKVRWEPSGTSGYILGVSEGTATITVTTRDGSKSATCQVTVQATDVPADPNGPIIQIDNVVGHVGNTVDVKISLINNPGIALANLLVSYDQELLTLSGIQFNESMGGSWTEPSSMNSPVPLLWYNDASNISGDCTYATLSFVVNESATGGTVTPITVAYQEDEICNIDETNISFAVENGEITIVDHIAGDITGDGKLNAKDLLRLAKYFSGWDVELNTHALDVTGDGKVNAKDLLRLAKYFAGWDVELH